MRSKNLKKSNPQGTNLVPKLDKRAISAFLKANPSLDLAQINTLQPKSLQGLNWGKQEQETLLPQLKALQRLVRLTKDLKTAQALYENGLHAALQIAAIPQHKFIQQYANLFTSNHLSSEEQAKQVHQRALARKSQALLTYTALAQHKSAHYQATHFNNLSALTDKNYDNLPSYQDLFGNLDFCTCNDCRSIFSPAAYLVDLMRLQDAYIDQDPAANPPAHLLQDRRPDLWNLVLDCEHTNTLVPKLEIVNKVLLQTLGKDATYEQLAANNYPFNLPFHLPLSQINLYLGQNDQSVARILEALRVELDDKQQLALARQTLGISPEQWTLYSTSKTDVKEVAALYGLKPEQDPVSTLADVDTFLTQTGLSYVQLQELLHEDLSDWELKEGLERYFFINLDTTGKATGFLYMDTDKNDGKEKLFNLTLERLDHINRFVRLAQALDWNFTDLDWALRTIGAIANRDNKNAPIIKDAILPYLAWMQSLQQQYKLSINQCCALIGMVKDFGQKNSPTFFDQTFNNPHVPNPPQWKSEQGKYSLVWNVSQPGSTLVSFTQDVQIQTALTAALKISQDDLLLIANTMLQAAAIKNSKLSLTLENLSILYRLSQLPILTGISIGECFMALQLPGQPQEALLTLAATDGKIAQPTLVLLQQFAQWLKNTPFSVYQLQFILKGTSQDPTIQNQILGSDKITNFLKELHTAVQPTLLIQERFNTALSTSMQRSGSSVEAIKVVYKGLQDKGYILKDSKVAKLFTIGGIRPIILQIFPKFVPISNPQTNVVLEVYISQLTHEVTQLLTSYIDKELSEDTFSAKAAPAFQQAMPLSCSLSLIWDALKTNKYIDSQGVITQFIKDKSTEEQNLKELIKSLLFSYIPQEVLANIQDLIIATINNTYQLQQKTLTQQLAGLYAISPNLVHALEVWGGLALGDLKTTQATSLGKENPYAAVPLLQKLLLKPTSKWNKARVLSADGQEAIKRLRLLQQYAVLLKSLSISPAEAQAMIDHPAYFGINYNAGKLAEPSPQFTLANIQTLVQFKQLIQGLQDNQNHLLDYFDIARSPLAADQVAKELSQRTQWEANQIQFLLHQLWPAPKKQAKKSSATLPAYATVAGISQLQAYFKVSKQLNIDIPTLWQLAGILKVTSYAAYQHLADALWAGLQKQYQDQPQVLSAVQGRLNEVKRSALLGLVMHQLRTQKNLSISTARDLYEYLLIDVETSGIIETSYVKEAISTVQLYVYRCLNALESGINVHPELNKWWSWIETYRTWQANREVFLYPENYIEPELRHDKTPQFIQLENELQQANLAHEDQVIAAFQHYMEGFAEVANLQIVGSAIKDHRTISIIEEESNKPKQLCLIGCTNQQPTTYYYRLVDFMPTSDGAIGQYAATQWNAWNKINLQMKPLGPVSPVYAFGKWFVFWIEQKQSDTKKSQDGTDQKVYTASIQFSYLNFSQTWVAPQTLVSLTLPDDANKKPIDITQLDDAHRPFWDRVYPVFFSSINAIMVPYAEDKNFNLYHLDEGILGKEVAMALRYATATPLNQGIAPLDAVYTNNQALYQYATTFGDKTLPSNSGDATLSTWFKLDKLPTTGTSTPLLGDSLSINSNGQLCINNVPTTNLPISGIETPETPAYARHNNTTYVAWIDKSQQLNYGILDSKNQLQASTILLQPTTTNPATSNHSPSLAVVNGKLFIAWVGAGTRIYYGQLQADKVSNQIIPGQTLTDTSSHSPALVAWKGKLYMACKANTSNILWYGELPQANEQVPGRQALTDATSKGEPSLAVLKDKLFVAWTASDSNQVYAGELNGANTVKNKQTLAAQSMYAPSLVTLNDKQLYLAWVGADKQLNYAELDLAKGIQHPQTILGVYSNVRPSWLNTDSALLLSWPLTNQVALYKTTSGFIYSQWNHIAVSSGSVTSGIQAAGSPSYVCFNNKLYAAWIDQNKQLYYGALDRNLQIQGTIKLMDTDGKTPAVARYRPSLAVWNNQLYMAWTGTDGSAGLNYGILDGSDKIQSKYILGETSKDTPNLVVFSNKLCIAWISNNNSNQLCYGELNGTNNVQNKVGLLSDVSPRYPSLVAWNNKLYMAYTANDDTHRLYYLELNGTGTPQNRWVLEEKSLYTPHLAIVNNSLYIAWTDLNGHITYGELDGTTSTVHSKQTLQSITTSLAPSWLITENALYLSGCDTTTNTVDLLTPPAVYLNGQCISTGRYPISTNSLLSIGVSTDGKNQLLGQMQETVLFHQVLSEADIAALYTRGKSQITHDFVSTVPANQAFTTAVGSIPILAQPNSYIISHKDAEFLAWPYQEDKTYAARLACWRLNTTAIKALSQILLIGDISDLLATTSQHIREIPFAILGPNSNYIAPANWPSDTIDFIQGGMQVYYWELFFHIPFLLGRSLSNQQQFELAKKWYAYIFDPTINQKDWDLVDKEDPKDKYWRFLGLRSQYNPILQAELNEPWTQEAQADLQDASQLYAYHNDPFDPHAIARLRPIAYQKTLVMHYVDNLLAWGDNLFRQYTIETIVEATMLYAMAYDLLGKQPVNLGPCSLPAPENLQQIAKHYQDSTGKIPEFLIEVEQSQAAVLAPNAIDTPHNYIPGDYFGLPENEQFMTYWDKIQQRLYNIRHNLNIDGVYQQLPLFDPAINPMQLVQAVAAGEGVGQALASNQVDVPYYRFNFMIAKAQGLVQTVIQLGQSLLAVLEKKDAEQLALLYNTNQQNLLALTRTSKQDQLEAATQSVLSLQASLQNAEDRFNHYTQLLNNGLSAGEVSQIALDGTAIYLQTEAQVVKGVSVAGYLMPTIFGTADGGMDPGDAISQGANMAEGTAYALSMASGLASTIAGYQRRAEDWQLQQTLAQDDKTQIQYQIVSAQYQERIAQQEISLLEKQVEQEQAIEAFLKNKFTRVQLYQWMVGKLSALYFQAYQLAYNLAIQAEKAWQFERGKQQTFIHTSYWDDLYQGLVAGESLQLDLQRMEKAYMDQDERYFEVEKVFSLAKLDPKALQDLKDKGVGTFDFLEKHFDQDYPGHYCRQIKSISFSLPLLLGPYQNIHATLTQTVNKTLLKADEKGVMYLLKNSGNQPDNSVLRVDLRSNQQIVLSRGLDDSGLFELNFNDARYLPFEGTGAVSSWQLKMLRDDNPAVDFTNLTDVIIRIRYTALSGGAGFEQTVRNSLKS